MPQFLLVPLFVLAGIYLARRSRSESAESPRHPGAARAPGKVDDAPSETSVETTSEAKPETTSETTGASESVPNHVDENGVTWAVIETRPDGSRTYLAGGGKYYGTMLISTPSGIAAVVTSYLAMNGFMPSAPVDTSPIVDRNGVRWALLYSDPSTGVISFSAMSGAYAGNYVNGRTRAELIAAIDLFASASSGGMTMTTTTESAPVALAPEYTMSFGPSINKA